MKKYLSPLAMVIMFRGAFLTAHKKFDDWFAALPDDSTGVEVDSENLKAAMNRIEDFAYIELEQLLGEIPVVPDPVEPEPEPAEPEGIRIAKTNRISINGKWRDRFVFPKLGPEYGQKLKFVFSDGNTFFVQDSSKRFQYNDNSNKYQPGGTYSYNPANPDIPTMEVYRAYGSKADWVELFAEGEIADPAAPVEPSGWIKIEWGGDPSLDWHSNDSRSRLWWTEIHGSSGRRDWSRKFPLPKRVESARSLDFEFSDGTKLHVSNPKKMAMLSNGPKYRPQDGNNEPNKNHPKVGAVPGSPVTWVKYKEN